jgi:serine phosphatase RsbU (regulator of sigma subunit)/DNA-binding response OmpR family regulator
MEKTAYRILMLEDTPTDAELIVANLRSAQLEFELHHTDDRQSYLRGLSEFGPNIVISDYGLAGYTGLAAYADMRIQGFDLPFILVTGSLPDELAVDCLKAGIDDYILKDRLSRLPEAIHNVFNKRHLDKERKAALKELVKSRHNLEVAEEMAGIGNWEWDVKSDKVIWSKNLYKLFGVDPGKEPPSRHMFFERLHPEDRDEIIKEMDLIINGVSNNARVKCRIVTPDGTIKMVQGVYSTNREDHMSRSLKVLGTVQDITMQFLTEKALRDLTHELEQRVDERTAQLSETNRQLERRNLEITDSMRYAKMIQQALLSDLSTFRTEFADSFVLWMPKDIVSGDFYWYHSVGDLSYVAAVDCTGHGVPGALMSAIGHQLLDRIMHSGDFVEPAEVLQELDNSIVQALRQEQGYRVQDGMDVALCRIDRKNCAVTFAGAFRPLFHYSGGQIHEISGTRAAIGASLVSRKFKQFQQQQVNCRKGDVLYLTSDGYDSQFGGEGGKKLMKNRFKQILLQVGALPIAEQKQRLKDEFHRWRGEEEQVDDVLIIGIAM